MRPLVRTAMKDTVSVSKQKSKAAAAEKAAQQQSRGANTSRKGKAVADSDGESADNNSRPAPERDFARTLSSAPKRLNDIAQAPPSLHAGPRLQRKVKDSSKDDGVISNAQKRMMELEREKAITRYRALKEAKLRDRDKDTIASELSVRA